MANNIPSFLEPITRRALSYGFTLVISTVHGEPLYTLYQRFGREDDKVFVTFELPEVSCFLSGYEFCKLKYKIKK